MSSATADLVSNELDVLAALLPLQQRAQSGQHLRVLEIGCGSARLLREMLELGLTRHAVGLEVDERQHTQNLSRPMAGLTCMLASATSVPFPDAHFDLALMLKSLHHVPLHQMARALDEAARVLKPGGWLYVSEPVYDGALNTFVKLFNDEGMVRMAAQLALDESLDRHDSPWTAVQEERFEMPVRYASCADFEQRMLYPTFADHRVDSAILEAVRNAYARQAQPDGSAKFTRPMHLRLLQKKA